MKINIDKDELYKIYITENRTKVDTAKYFNCSTSRIDGALSEYKIKKDITLAKQNRKQGVINKYGVDNVAKLTDFAERSKKSTLERYGVENISQLPSIKQKKQQTSLLHYGVVNPSQSNEIKAKKRQTMQNNFGVDYPYQNEEIKNKAKKSCQALYGVDNFSKSWRNERTNLILLDKKHFIAYLSQIPFEQRTINYLLGELDIKDSCLRTYISKYECQNLINYYRVKPEQEIKQLLDSWGIKCYQTQSVLKNMEIDLFCPDYNIGIEFNGNFYHSNIAPNYHQQKSLEARRNDIFIYHIFEYEWTNERKKSIIISQLASLFKYNTTTIYARKCCIKEIDAKTASQFLNENHLQGYCRSSIKLGLLYNNELVALMTFGLERFKKKNKAIELIRFCVKRNYNIPGAASRLFKYFCNKFNPNKIISFCDIGKGRGGIYEMLGFHLDGVINPNYVWFKGNSILTRYETQMPHENETMLQQGYRKIYDCGNFKYIWENK